MERMSAGGEDTEEQGVLGKGRGRRFYTRHSRSKRIRIRNDAERKHSYVLLF